MSTNQGRGSNPASRARSQGLGSPDPSPFRDAPLSQGVDDEVKTLYATPRRSKELNCFSEGPIVNRQPSIVRTAPVMGPCAFVRAAMSFSGQRGGYPHALRLAALKRALRNREDEDQVHPGEGSA